MKTTTADRIFFVATGLIALHVVDDSFLQPPAGTSAADHIASGLIPLGALALAATVFPRLRSGARGVLALLIGLLGSISGGEAIYYASQGALSGDDYTGVLAIPAGLTLIALGAVTLWESRRRDESRAARYAKRGLFAAAVAVGLFVTVFPIGVGYMNTHVQTASVPEAELGADYEDVTFMTDDGLELEGWFVPSRNGATVIVFPGRDGPQKHARMLIDNGYGVLLFDRRGEGASDGAPNGFGWGGERDVDAAIAYLRSRDDVDPDRIAGLGLSVGGEMMIQAAAEDHDGLAAVVSEGAGTRSYAEESSQNHGLEGVIGAPVLLMKTAAVSVFSDTAPPPSMLDLVSRVSPTPLLLISSQDAPNEKLSETYAELAEEPSTHWAVPGNHHIGGITVQPEEYERTVISFLDETLAEPGR